MYDGHRDMLHDRERNEAYRDAIERTVAQLTRRGGTVEAIDIGTGSGLLACFAAQAGASRVTAYEINPALERLARRVVEDNALCERISVQGVHSTEAHCELRSTTLMTHELLDTGLHSEGLLAAVRHAWAHLLAPDALSVPQRVALYAQPVHSPFLRAAATLSPSAPLVAPASVLDCSGAAGYLELLAAPLLGEMHGEVASCVPLAAPAKLLEWDLNVQPPEGEQRPPPTRLAPLIDEGDAAGFCSLQPDALLTWWDCTLHPDTAPLSTSPHRPLPHAEREHWKNAVYLLPEAKRRALTAGGAAVRVAYDDHEMWMDLAVGEAATGASLKRCVCSCGMHVLWGPQRLQQLNSIDAAAASAAAKSLVATALARRHAGAVRCVDLSDGPLWSILVAKEGARCTCVERTGAMRTLSARFAATAGCSRLIELALEEAFGAGGDDEEEDEAEAEEEAESEATLAPELCGPPFDALLIEPSFTQLQRSWSGEHLAEIDRRWRWAVKRGLVSASAPMLPRSAKVYACMLECEELWRRHQRVGEVCGVDVHRFNSLAPSDESSVRSLAVWELRHAVVSSVECWANMQLPLDAAGVVEGTAALRSASVGVCHAICCWVDFAFHADGADEPHLVTQTGCSPASSRFTSSPWMQGVVLLGAPRQLAPDELIETRLTLDLRRGGELQARLL